MKKAYQKILREKIASKDKQNLFNMSLYLDNPNLKNAKIREITFAEAKAIIMKYEWLQSMPHRFGYRVSHGIYFNNILGGALVYAQPQVRSKNLFNKDYGTRSVIQLSRGACSHWTPKGTATKLISKSSKMLKKEGIKAIVAYCTPEAGEIGTIYQASNFIYYGKTEQSYEYLLDGRWIGERSYAHKKKWLSKLEGDIKKKYEIAFSCIKKRKMKPRFKFIKLLCRQAKINFQHKSLPYPKRLEEYK